MNLNQLRNNGLEFDNLLFLNDLLKELFNFDNFGYFNDSFNNLLDDLLDNAWFFNKCFLSYDNLLSSWDLNNFFLDNILLLVDDVVLDVLNNFFNKSFNFFDVGLCLENLDDLLNNLWDLNNLFLDVWD